jgi:hypothetical protein
MLETALVDAPSGATVRVEMTLPEALVFSYEFRVPVVERLGALGAALELCINTDEEPRLSDFDCYQDGGHLHVWMGDRHPHEATALTGLTPTKVMRVGDRIGGPSSTRTAKQASWHIELEHEPAIEPSALAHEICDRFSPAAAAACRAYDLRLRFTFMTRRLRGGLLFEREAISRIAALHVPLACYFYNGF